MQNVWLCDIGEMTGIIKTTGLLVYFVSGIPYLVFFGSGNFLDLIIFWI